MSVPSTNPPPCVSFPPSAESGAGDVKALQGEREELRLRMGDYRLFFVHTTTDTIEIRRVLHRREAYR
ncbi:MAG: type II toxin-antitoxin system RelE/ParE family toxin [Terriglobia bacterium]|jgi:mRNA-degrading endonuclease RelE of RelBE toxin-antitoxin system